jgi:FK506-binding protein 1
VRTLTGSLFENNIADETCRFDSSADRGDFVTQIGVGRLIRGRVWHLADVSFPYLTSIPLILSFPGWDEAVLDMRVGEEATLDITRSGPPLKKPITEESRANTFLSSDYGYGEK